LDEPFHGGCGVDDLGVLKAFNRMQAGLAERQRLQGAFGTYVDPLLASRGDGDVRRHS
jgi:hypothetical protein